MSAGATVVFQADLSAVYQAYAAFLAYVRANPAQVQFGGGPGGGGGGPTYITNNIVNNYYGGGGPGGPGGGGGGGGGGAGGGGGRSGYGGFGRFFRPAYIAREGLRAADAYVNYQEALSGATSPLERLQAERSLQSHLYSIPIVGQVAQLATAGQRLGTEQILQQAQQQARYNDLLQKSIDTHRQYVQQGAAIDAGPAGSYGRRQQDIDNEYERDRLRIEKERTEKAVEIDRARELRISNAESKYNIGLASYYASWLTGVPGLIASAKGYGSKTPAQLAAERDREEQAANESGPELARKAAALRDRDLALAEKERADRLKELQYQQHEEAVRARGGAEVARLEYERKPEVADVEQIYNAGRARIESDKHRQNTEAAKAEADRTTYDLLRLQFKLRFGGNAEEFDPFTQDFGQGKNTGYIQGDPLKTDDILEALGRIDQRLADIYNETKGL
jgi:hypothetical protein